MVECVGIRKMLSLDITIVWNPSITIEDLLVYIGTILVGFEFVRKLNRLELMFVLIAAWPLGSMLDIFSALRRRKRIDWSRFNRRQKMLKILYGLILIIILCPVTIISIVLALVVEALNDFNKLLNWLWRKIMFRFRGITREVAILIIEKIKRYRGLSVRKVVDEVHFREIPFWPIIGIILITIGLILKL